MEDTTNIIEMPLFPLNTVLFPGQVLPLHIFEDRYRLMIRRCLAEEMDFGVVLIRKGVEVGASAEPHAIGTLAHIIESSHLPDGTMNILTVGTERFRILRLLHDQPYLRGEVEILPQVGPSDAGEASLIGLTDRVRVAVGRYIQLISEAAGLQIEVGEMPDGPQQVGYLAAVAMQIDLKEKQALLGLGSANQVLAAEVALLGRENALLKWMVESKAWPEREQFGPSGTLLPN